MCGKAAYNYGKAALESNKTLKEQRSRRCPDRCGKAAKRFERSDNTANKGKAECQNDYEEVNGVKLIVLKLDSVEAKEAKDIIDRAKNENEKVAILLIRESSGKIALTAGVKGGQIRDDEKWSARGKKVAQKLGGNGGDMSLPPLEVRLQNLVKSKKR